MLGCYNVTSKISPSEIDCVMKSVIEVVNFIKEKAPRTSLKNCEDMATLYENLLY